MQRKYLLSLQREIKCFNHECPTWVETKFSFRDKIDHSFPTTFKDLLNTQRYSSIHFEHMSSSTFRYRRIIICLYIITTVKHAIWLVNTRAGSGYPARGIKMPSRDFRGTLEMSLFHCSYFIKQLPNGFPSRIAWSMHLGCCSTFGKRKNTLACGSSIFTLSESLATSLVHGSRNPARKTIRYSFNTIQARGWFN
jgi:hypothetical protein